LEFIKILKIVCVLVVPILFIRNPRQGKNVGVAATTITIVKAKVVATIVLAVKVEVTTLVVKAEEVAVATLAIKVEVTEK
jgi:hypothetical protein